MRVHDVDTTIFDKRQKFQERKNKNSNRIKLTLSLFKIIITHVQEYLSRK